jgi:hypothetical protein
MTARQLAILREYGGWMLADILIDPDRGIAQAKQSRYGCTSFRVEGEEFCMATTARGIQLYRWEADGARQNYDLLPWSRVVRFVRTLPADVVAEVRASRQELTRSVASHPACPAGASDEERERWERNRYKPWLARHWNTRARLEAALDAALRTGARPQPGLFNLNTAPRQPTVGRTSRAGTRRTARVEQDRLL